MVPPPTYKSIGSAFDAICQPDEKPRFQACKSLFGRSDPMETRRMLNATLDNEKRRLVGDWEFDAAWVTAAAKPVSKPRLTVPASPRKRRFEWELLDSASVPQFYVRGPRRHHSETCKLLESRRQRLSPMPLSCRDENASPNRPTKSTKKNGPSKRLCRGLSFASPPKITEGNINTSLARFVTALRVPLPTFCEVTPEAKGSTVESPKHASPLRHADDVTVSSPPPCNVQPTTPRQDSTKTEGYQTTVKTNLSGATTGSKRQLFAKPCEESKHRKDVKGCVQMTLTEMMPRKKLRSSTIATESDKAKPASGKLTNSSQTPTEASQ
uniref:Cyclin-dependent kinase inhibitor 1B n=1 Tax=Phallusia mammillata TaxID=59560 RepID=A0A6F9D9H4_9ASCI|nr:cyclin-dependent kinase inhibitor 1B [Phallusia mammillata]